jgi:hypothetical protein
MEMSVSYDDCIALMKEAHKAEIESKAAAEHARKTQKAADDAQYLFEKYDARAMDERKEIAKVLSLIEKALDGTPEVVAFRKATMVKLISRYSNDFKDIAEQVMRARKGDLDEKRRYEQFLVYVRTFEK